MTEDASKGQSFVPTPGYDWSRAVTALENWGRHFDWCESRTTSEPFPCNCGLARELEDLRAQANTGLCND